jgi:hypothetical protein
MDDFRIGVDRVHAAAVEQAAYRRRVAAFGLPALLAPYTVRRLVSLPRHRRWPS